MTTKNKMLIGFSGLPGSGKDLSSFFLSKKYGFSKMKVAEKLKDSISIIFGLDRNMLDGNTIKERVERESFVNDFTFNKFLQKNTPRLIMEMFSMALKSTFGKNIFIFGLAKTIDEKLDSNLCISDLRFENELEYVRSIGGIIINLERVGNSKIKTDLGDTKLYYDTRIVAENKLELAEKLSIVINLLDRGRGLPEEIIIPEYHKYSKLNKEIMESHVDEIIRVPEIMEESIGENILLDSTKRLKDELGHIKEYYEKRVKTKEFFKSSIAVHSSRNNDLRSLSRNTLENSFRRLNLLNNINYEEGIKLVRKKSGANDIDDIDYVPKQQSKITDEEFDELEKIWQCYPRSEKDNNRMKELEDKIKGPCFYFYDDDKLSKEDRLRYKMFKTDEEINISDRDFKKEKEELAKKYGNKCKIFSGKPLNKISRKYAIFLRREFVPKDDGLIRLSYLDPLFFHYENILIRESYLLSSIKNITGTHNKNIEEIILNETGSSSINDEVIYKFFKKRVEEENKRRESVLSRKENADNLKFFSLPPPCEENIDYYTIYSPYFRSIVKYEEGIRDIIDDYKCRLGEQINNYSYIRRIASTSIDLAKFSAVSENKLTPDKEKYLFDNTQKLIIAASIAFSELEISKSEYLSLESSMFEKCIYTLVINAKESSRNAISLIIEYKKNNPGILEKFYSLKDYIIPEEDSYATTDYSSLEDTDTSNSSSSSEYYFSSREAEEYVSLLICEYKKCSDREVYVDEFESLVEKYSRINPDEVISIDRYREAKCVPRSIKVDKTILSERDVLHLIKECRKIDRHVEIYFYESKYTLILGRGHISDYIKSSNDVRGTLNIENLSI